MLGEAAHHLLRRRFQIREGSAELGQRSRLDSPDQTEQDVIEYFDLVLAEPVGVREEQARHLPQYPDAAFG
ncbi:hypothetical protein [Bradyrhizobium cenepequi]|uniref:hypothetical protein n=1 Tax=Bradyrhizobium cenepequi TaxID=2821403 RepID=UPI001CE29904|nr:hypothetical protein [Bradyrhizobium cenepequi]MCA6107310.1 hypothetical protein [Bradyrhizobium cenepequi]